jgi:hypothetical protein
MNLSFQSVALLWHGSLATGRLTVTSIRLSRRPQGPEMWQL